MDKKTNKSLFIGGIIIVTLLVVAGFVIRTSQENQESETRVAVQIIDGDTFVVDTGDYIRLIGVNAPEEDENFYNESADFLKSLIFLKDISLEKDKSDKDAYGQLLRYAYLDYKNGTTISINQELARNGYAKPLPVYPDFKYRLEIERAWQDCLNEGINLCA